MRTSARDVPGLWVDPLGTSMKRWRQEGDFVRFRVGPVNDAFLVVHPDQIRHVLHTRRDIYRRDPTHAAALRRVSGSGLTASEGRLWQEQRRLLRGYFQGLRRESIAAGAEARTAALVAEWHRKAEAGTPIELSGEMLRLALETITDVLFGCSFGDRSTAVVEDSASVLAALHRSMLFPSPRVSQLTFTLDRRFARAHRALRARARQIVAQASHAGEEESFLALANREMGPCRAADQVITMILAGHDTTGAALSWALLLIARHPELAHELRVESRSLPDPGAIGAAELPIASAVFREVLRLYPPAWMLSRSPTAEDEIDGRAIPAGATVFISPFVTHRHPACWPHPERFDPHRLRGSERGSPYAYLPFGAGSRMCIGNAVAEVLGQVAISMITREFELVPLPGYRQVTPRPRLTLHPAPRPLIEVRPT